MIDDDDPKWKPGADRDDGPPDTYYGIAGAALLAAAFCWSDGPTSLLMFAAGACLGIVRERWR